MRVAVGVVPDGRDFAEVTRLRRDLTRRFGAPLYPGGVAWSGDMIDDICGEMATDIAAGPEALQQVRAFWDRERQRVPHPMLVVVAMVFPPTGLKAGELSVQEVGSRRRES